MSLICIRQTPESDGTGKSTLEKGGRDPPDVTLDKIAENLFSFYKDRDNFNKTEENITKKYDIKKEHGHNCWPEDDIKRAWGKIQRMNINSDKRNHWSAVIIWQIVKRRFVCGECKLQAAQENRHATTDEQGCETTPSLTGNPEDRSSQSSAELETVGAARGVQKSSGRKHTARRGKHTARRGKHTARRGKHTARRGKKSSGGKHTRYSAQKYNVIQGQTATHFTCWSQVTGNPPGAGDGQDRPGVALHNEGIHGPTYIRIPFRLMSYNETLFEVQDQRVPEQGRHYKFINGSPSASTDRDLWKNKSYAMSFNRETNNARWVYEILNRQTLADNPYRTQDGFGDPYQKGHLAAAANHRWCQEAHNHANFFSNIVPQHRTLNMGPWKAAENRCRELTKERGIRNVHVYTGPLYLSPENLWIQEKALPTHFFKVILVENENGTVREPECYLMPNDNVRPYQPLRKYTPYETLAKYRKTIDQIEQDSGLTFIERTDVRGNDQTVIMTMEGISIRKDGCVERQTAAIQAKIRFYDL